MTDGKVVQSTLAKSLTAMPVLAPTRESFGYLSICLWAGATQPTAARGCHPTGLAPLTAGTEPDANPRRGMICLLPRVVLTQKPWAIFSPRVPVYINCIHQYLFIYRPLQFIVLVTKSTHFALKKKKVPKQSPKIDIKVAFSGNVWKMFSFRTIVFLSSGLIFWNTRYFVTINGCLLKSMPSDNTAMISYEPDSFLWSNAESFSVKIK